MKTLAVNERNFKQECTDLFVCRSRRGNISKSGRKKELAFIRELVILAEKNSTKCRSMLRDCYPLYRIIVVYVYSENFERINGHENLGDYRSKNSSKIQFENVYYPEVSSIKYIQKFTYEKINETNT